MKSKAAKNRFMNIQRIFLIVLMISVGFQVKAQEGEALFKTNCSACHKYTTARLVGPGLANVHLRWTEERFMSFVKSSQSMIKSGDEQANAIFEEFKEVPMPDQALSQPELKSIYDFIISKSPSVDDTQELVEEVVMPHDPSADDILQGQNLFVGLASFTNKGASCNSCHHVQKDDLMAGGSLAVELTDAYSRLGKEGVEAVITGLPFPAMKNTYGKHKVTPEEAYYLASFLKDVNENQYIQYNTNYGNVLLIWGVIGAFVIMGLIPAFWFRRKKDSVNLRIYERQIKSIN